MSQKVESTFCGQQGILPKLLCLVDARSITSSAGQNTGGIYEAWRCCPLLRLVDPHLRHGSCKLVVHTFDGRSEDAVELHTSSSGLASSTVRFENGSHIRDLPGPSRQGCRDHHYCAGSKIE